jgi:putative FmdB family regulatory protein
MPKYLYKCQKCSQTLEVYHSMNEVREDCTACESDKVLKKMPNKITYSSTEKKDQAIGNVVKQSIEEFQNDLEEQKLKLKSELYGTDK